MAPTISAYSKAILDAVLTLWNVIPTARFILAGKFKESGSPISLRDRGRRLLTKGWMSGAQASTGSVIRGHPKLFPTAGKKKMFAQIDVIKTPSICLTEAREWRGNGSVASVSIHFRLNVAQTTQLLYLDQALGMKQASDATP